MLAGLLRIPFRIDRGGLALGCCSFGPLWSLVTVRACPSIGKAIRAALEGGVHRPVAEVVYRAHLVGIDWASVEHEVCAMKNGRWPCRALHLAAQAWRSTDDRCGDPSPSRGRTRDAPRRRPRREQPRHQMRTHGQESTRCVIRLKASVETSKKCSVQGPKCNLSQRLWMRDLGESSGLQRGCNAPDVDRLFRTCYRHGSGGGMRPPAKWTTDCQQPREHSSYDRVQRVFVQRSDFARNR